MSARRADSEVGFEDDTAPFEAPVAGNGHEPAEVLADRRDADGLPPDVSGAIGPDHVLAGDVARGAGRAEFLPGLGLVHPETRQIR